MSQQTEALRKAVEAHKGALIPKSKVLELLAALPAAGAALTAEQMRPHFEWWWTTRGIFPPIGSPECAAAWSAWIASGHYTEPGGWKVSPMPWGYEPFARAAIPAEGAEPTDASLYLCRAWGETDLPCAEVVTGWDGVRAFMVREWLGSADSTDCDGTLTLDWLKEDFDEHEEDERGGPYEVSFEIGGVSIERVGGVATRPLAAPTPSSTPSGDAQDAALTDEQEREAFEKAMGFSLVLMRDVTTDEYLGAVDRAAWRAWQARAAMSKGGV